MRKPACIIALAGTLWTASLSLADSPLADAAERKDRAALTSLLKAGADVNAPQPDGSTPLHWAAWQRDLETAKLLVTAGGNAKAKNRYDISPVIIAAQNGDCEMVELLLEAGADPNTEIAGGETVLMIAARTGKAGCVKPLLSRGAEVNERNRKGQTALMWAAAAGHADVVRHLLDAKADFTNTLESGFNAFFFAVREGRGEVVTQLLEAGFDVHTPMEPRHTGGRNVRKGTSGLMLAVENGHFSLAADLLKAGADPNDSRSGFTPLHALTWVRRPVLGEDPNGEPPPIGSGTLSSLGFVRTLVKSGADVNSRLKRAKPGKADLSLDGATPFLMAAWTCDIPLMQLLLELGADPHIANSDNCTPLMAAAGIGVLAPGEEPGNEADAIETIKFLLSLGLEVNAVDDNGETAMHGAAYKGSPGVVRLLTESGAKVELWNRKNRHGWTPLRIAEGYRPGNFRPSAPTIAALQDVMLAAGIAPPTNDPAPVKATGY